MVLRIALILLALIVLAGLALWLAAREAIGGTVDGERLDRAERSPQWRDGRFQNRLARNDGPMLEILTGFAFGGSEHSKPGDRIPIVQRTGEDYRMPPASGLRVSWFGHSTLLLEIDGHRVLVDPVWSDHAAPLAILGSKRFFPPPLPLEELPAVDVIVISHDHYDHLDMPTVKALAARQTRWLVPLGVGAHLVAWGVAERNITELDWWERVPVGTLMLTATPARHFSGRGLTGAGTTLWSGWAIAGPAHKVFYSGDTGLHDEFDEIGRRLGPFDLTMIEAGAYDALWPDVHMGPEQAVLAHRLVGGDLLLPVHWGLFDLAMHGWTEPIERVLAAAQPHGVRVATPRPGEMVEPATFTSSARWWPRIAWKTAAEAPVVSTGIGHVRK